MEGRSESAFFPIITALEQVETDHHHAIAALQASAATKRTTAAADHESSLAAANQRIKDNQRTLAYHDNKFLWRALPVPERPLLSSGLRSYGETEQSWQESQAHVGSAEKALSNMWNIYDDVMEEERRAHQQLRVVVAVVIVAALIVLFGLVPTLVTGLR